MTTNENPSTDHTLNLEPTPSAWGTPDSAPSSPMSPEPGPMHAPPAAWQTPPHTPHPEAPGRGNGFFDGIRALGLSRAEHGRMVGGVAAGLGQRWGISPVAVRVGFVVLSLIFGVGLLLYGLLWMFLPQADGRIHAQELLRGRITAGFVGALIAVLAGVPFEFADDGRPTFLPIVLVAGLAWLILRRRNRIAA